MIRTSNQKPKKAPNWIPFVRMRPRSERSEHRWFNPQVGLGLIGVAMGLSLLQLMLPLPRSIGVALVVAEVLIGLAGIIVIIKYNTRPKLGDAFIQTLYNVSDEDDEQE